MDTSAATPQDCQVHTFASMNTVMPAGAYISAGSVGLLQGLQLCPCRSW